MVSQCTVYSQKPSFFLKKLTVDTAKTTVDNWDLSPHSAIKVRTKAFKNTGLRNNKKKVSIFFIALFNFPSSSTTSGVLFLVEINGSGVLVALDE